MRDDELGQLLRTLGARKTAIIVDSCYSSSKKEEKGIPGVDEGGEGRRDGITTSDYLPADMTIILEACAPNEVTLDGTTAQSNSEFTENLIEALRRDDVDKNRDSVTSFDELHLHLTQILSLQTPGLIGKEAAETFIIPSYVYVTSNPLGVRIFVDGQDRNIKTPANVILLDAEEHQIELRNAGYHVWPEGSKQVERSRVKSSRPGKHEDIEAQLSAIVVTGKL